MNNTEKQTLIDGRVGLAQYHLGGAECDPHVQKMIAGFSLLQVDRKTASLLGMDWRQIPHLA